MASLATSLPIAHFDSDLYRIDEELENLLGRGKHDTRVLDAMRYAVLDGGRRIRPVMALRVARVLNANASDVLRAACCVELLHCASLIVDDLPCMDDSDMRRGRQSLHVAFGESTAVLAAFALVALAAKACIDYSRPTRRLACFQRALLSTLDVNALIAGQYIDLAERPNRGDRLVQAALLKTVPLFELAVRAGMAASSAPAMMQRLLLDFGRSYGIAFQLADDRLDGDGSAPEDFRQAIAGARKALLPFGTNASELHELIDRIDA